MRLPRRMPLGWRPVGIAILRRLAREHRSVGGLAHDDLRLWTLLCQHARYALQRSAGAESGDEVVQAIALEVVDDLARGGARMEIGVRLVLELARHEPAVLRRELLRFLYHAGASRGRRRGDDLGAEEAHQSPA